MTQGLILPLFPLCFLTLERPQRRFRAPQSVWGPGDPRPSPVLALRHGSPSGGFQQRRRRGSRKELSGEAAMRRRSCFLSFCLVVAGWRMWVMPFALPVFEFACWRLLGVENGCELGTAPG